MKIITDKGMLVKQFVQSLELLDNLFYNVLMEANLKRLLKTKLAALMEERGINVMQLHKQAGVSRNTIYAYMRNDIEGGDFTVIVKLADFFGLKSISEIVEFEEESEGELRRAS